LRLNGRSRGTTQRPGHNPRDKNAPQQGHLKIPF